MIITKPKATWTATLGLVVHAAADGIALGAASATNQFNIEFIVFMAIMLHKVKTCRFNEIRPIPLIGTGSIWFGLISNVRWC